MTETWLPAALAAVVAGCAVSLIVRPRRALGSRLRPYAALGRSRLGTGYADVSVVNLARTEPGSAVSAVFGPLVSRWASGLSRLIDVADNETLRLRLRQAGWADTDPEQYRIRQLAWTVGGLVVGAMLGALWASSAVGFMLCVVGVGFFSATRLKGRVQSAISERQKRMQSEAYTVAQLVAVHIRTGHGPIEAVRAVCSLGRGPVVDELREALNWISGGTSPQRAYDKLAEMTPEPAAARLYRLLSASSRTGGDVAQALLAVAADLRDERREQIARAAVRRRTAMLLPLLLFIAPVMVLFVAAALPSLILG